MNRPQPFGSMPADSELAAFGVGVGGLMLGLVTGDVVSGVAAGQRIPFVLHTVWPWLSVTLAGVALVVAAQVTGLALRVALIAFAAVEILALASVAVVVPFSSWIAVALRTMFAGGLLIATWPRVGRSARVVAVALFIAAALRPWFMQSPSSVVPIVVGSLALSAERPDADLCPPCPGGCVESSGRVEAVVFVLPYGTWAVLMTSPLAKGQKSLADLGEFGNVTPLTPPSVAGARPRLRRCLLAPPLRPAFGSPAATSSLSS